MGGCYIDMEWDTAAGDERHEIALEAFSHPDRRLAIAALQEHEPPITLHQLARAMLARNDETSVTTTDRLAVGLHHHHLPKLTETGMIEYDPSMQTVTRIDLSDRKARQEESISPESPSPCLDRAIRMPGCESR